MGKVTDKSRAEFYNNMIEIMLEPVFEEVI